MSLGNAVPVWSGLYHEERPCTMNNVMFWSISRDSSHVYNFFSCLFQSSWVQATESDSFHIWRNLPTPHNPVECLVANQWNEIEGVPRVISVESQFMLVSSCIFSFFSPFAMNVFAESVLLILDHCCTINTNGAVISRYESDLWGWVGMCQSWFCCNSFKPG